MKRSGRGCAIGSRGQAELTVYSTTDGEVEKQGDIKEREKEEDAGVRLANELYGREMKVQEVVDLASP